MMHEYEVECLVVSKDTGRKVRSYRVQFRKPKEQWSMTDYYVLEQYLGKRKDINGDVSIIEVRNTK
jgi:hypothetical protein